MSGHHDEDWFRHSEDEGLPQDEHAAHVSAGALGVTFLVITFGVVGLVLILSMYFVSYTREIKTTRLEGTQSAAQYRGYRSGAETRLNNASWVDRESGVVRVPLDRAMDLVIGEYEGRSTASASDTGGPGL